ncbi:MAG: cysteine hydrolase family protein [Chloroflexota bacterium]
MTKQALLIIDVQNCMFNPVEPVFNSDTILTHLANLIDRARTAQTEVIYIQHNGPSGAPHEPGEPGWEIHPKIAPLPNELVIQKTTPDSFYQTDLKEELMKRGIDQLVTAGIQTDYCVDTTCRRASSEGYKVILVQDAHSTWGNESLTAEQIISHHNQVLGNWFADVKPTEAVQFQ